MAYREGSSYRFAVYEILKSVTLLSDNYRLFAHNGSTKFDSVEALMAIERFSSRNMNSSSMMTTAESSLPMNIDTTNVTQMKDLYHAVNRYTNGRGRVDFSIVDRSSGKIKCIVEVNESLGMVNNSSNSNSSHPSTKIPGFWEMAHDLVHTHYLNGSPSKGIPLYGILTDYKQWIFFKLEGNLIIHSIPLILHNGDLTTPELSDQLYTISKFLFEIYQISGNTNLKQKNEAVSVFKKNFAEASLLTLKDNLRIAQEIRKKDDEIVRLKEELAKLKNNKPSK
jgi:hypothetical protein